MGRILPIQNQPNKPASGIWKCTGGKYGLCNAEGSDIIISGKWSTADKTLRENAAMLQQGGARLDATTVGRSHHTRRVPFLQWNVRQHTGALLSRGCRSQGIFQWYPYYVCHVPYVFMQIQVAIYVGENRRPFFHRDARLEVTRSRFKKAIMVTKRNKVCLRTRMFTPKIYSWKLCT